MLDGCPLLATRRESGPANGRPEERSAAKCLDASLGVRHLPDHVHCRMHDVQGSEASNFHDPVEWTPGSLLSRPHPREAFSTVSLAQPTPDLAIRGTGVSRHSTRVPVRQRYPLVIVTVIYCLVGLIPYWHLWNAGQTRFAGIGADVEEYAWFLQWVPSAIIHGHNPLFTDWGNYPFGANGVTNTSLPLLGVLAAPLTFATNVFVSVTALFMLAFPLSALGGYALCRRFVAWRPAAFIGGLLSFILSSCPCRR
jgi:hypothetical protein